MAILDRRVKADEQSTASRQQQPDQPFAEINAKEFERARKDPKVQELLSAADRHLEILRAEGRID